MVETLLVLAISALMLMGFMAGIGVRIGAQRYSDATNDFADFLRRVYTETINVEIERTGHLRNNQENYCTLAGQKANAEGKYTGGSTTTAEKNGSFPGRSGCAVYGKLISFGEDPTGDTIYVYDVIGRAVDINHPLTASDAKQELINVHADVLSYNQNDNGTCSLTTAGTVATYRPQWASRIENTNKGSLYQGAVLIVRSPNSGSVRTFSMEGQTMPIQQLIQNNQNGNCSSTLNSVVNNVNNAKGSLIMHLNNDNNGNSKFELKDANFCVASEQIFSAIGRRNNIRIKNDGRNADSVVFVETDLSKNQGGNQC